MPAHTILIDIEPDDCADLLGSAPIGRLGVVVHGHPEIFPVNHVYDRESGCVVFPTDARTKLHAALNEPEVAFEVDGVSPEGDRGWSVLVVGHAEEITDPDTIARVARVAHRALAHREPGALVAHRAVEGHGTADLRLRPRVHAAH